MADSDHQDNSAPLKRQKTDAEQESRLIRTESKGARFKILAHLVMAAKRFQATLNPSYTYGDSKQKVNADTAAVDGALARVATANKTGSGRTASGRAGSGRTASGKPARAASTHGHKSSLLFRPLAPVELEA